MPLSELDVRYVIIGAACALVSFVIAYTLTPALARLGKSRGIVDEIDDRRMHADPKPRLGGVAVLLAFAAGMFISIGLGLRIGYFGEPELYALCGLVIGGLLISAGGLWDDIVGMRPRTKLAYQSAVIVATMIYGFHIEGIRNPVEPASYVHFAPAVSVILTYLWYVGIINAINFIDGLDGLLPGMAVISGTFLCVIAAHKHQPMIALAVLALIASCLAFLRFNYNPASIILGDNGSQLIGYVFASVAIIGTSKEAFTISLAIPILLLAVPILDTAFAIVRRVSRGLPISQGDRGHFHHILVFRFGFTIRRAVILLYVLFALCGLIGYTLSLRV